MKKLNNIKWFSLGVIVCILVSSLAFSAIAANRQQQATLLFRDIRITLDGDEIVPRDAAGNIVEPFIIDGTTFLPVRGVAGALGLDVDWIDATSTVVLTSGIAQPPQPPAPPPPPSPPATQSSLIGTWNWLGSPYYRFEEGGRGVMVPGAFETVIRWWTNNGVLYICTTPDTICTWTRCLAPTTWYYVIDGNRLTLTSTVLSSMVFEYTRG